MKLSQARGKLAISERASHLFAGRTSVFWSLPRERCCLPRALDSFIMENSERGSNYSKVKANRLAFHPASRESAQPSFFSWVLDGQLAGMALPTSDAQIQTLRATHNIGLVCSLIEEPSCPPLSLFEPEELAPKSLHVEWRDMSIPTRQQMDLLLSTSHDYITKGEGVVYHCFGGKGRTGTALACYLLRYHADDWTAETVIPHIRELRPNSIETSSQELFIRNYERFLKGEPMEETKKDENEQPKWFTVKLRSVAKDS